MMQSLKFKGEFNVVVTKADGSKTETGWFPNLILNTGLDRLGDNTNQATRFARVGTGTSAPSILNTTLDSQIAASAAAVNGGAVNSGAPDYSSVLTFSYTFTQGAVVGNITEIGVGWDTADTATLWSRALILDVSQTPISISITAIDQLTVFYRLTVFPTVTDITGTVNISGTDYGYTGRLAVAGSFMNTTNTFLSSSVGNHPAQFNTNIGGFFTYGAGATLGPITGSPSGTSIGQNISPSYSTYTPGSYFRDSTASLTTGQGNVAGGIQALYVPLWGTSTRYQYLFDAPIPKDNTKTFSMTFRTAWNRL